jgi:hypothetical protein
MRRLVRASVAGVAALAMPFVSAAVQPRQEARHSLPATSLPSGDLMSVSAVTSRDVWAIGSDVRTDILHWNGITWSRVKSPSPGVGYLAAVSARTARDAWAVGVFTPRPGARAQPLVERWNGTHWSMVRTQFKGYRGSSLDAVAAVSADDAWAVGQYCPNECFNQEVRSQALILHWNGTRWARVLAPGPCDGNNDLRGVAAVSGRVAWAVGECDSTRTERQRPLLLRWNGTRWSASKGPDLRSAVNIAWSVTGVSPSDAWAVGQHQLGYTQATLILHWNGRKWSRVPSPDPAPNGNRLYSVSAVSAKDVWAAGLGAPSQGGTMQILTLRWNGSTWSQVSNTAGAVLGPTIAVSADRANDAWIAGPPTMPGCGCPLVMHWDGVSWSEVS